MEAIQGYGNGTCAAFACCIVAGQRGERVPEALAILADVVGGPVSLWNDVHGRTEGEVLKAFDRAIAVAKEMP